MAIYTGQRYLQRSINKSVLSELGTKPMKSSNNVNSDASVVEGLSTLLTPSQISKMAQKALVELKLGQVSLKSSLENQQWKTSAKQAHRLKSTLGLLTAKSLVQSLDLIESGNDEQIHLPEFRQKVITQCEALIDNLENYLANCSE